MSIRIIDHIKYYIKYKQNKISDLVNKKVYIERKFLYV